MQTIRLCVHVGPAVLHRYLQHDALRLMAGVWDTLIGTGMGFIYFY